jgi:hypothetical protein
MIRNAIATISCFYSRAIATIVGRMALHNWGMNNLIIQTVFSPSLPVSPSPRLPVSPSQSLPVSPSPRLRVSPSPRLPVSPSYTNHTFIQQRLI